MKESSKTAILIAVALLVVLIAWLVQPTGLNDSPEKAVGKVLFDRFTDPLTIRSLEINRLLPKTGELVKFQITDNQGKWTIPSHENYPADAKEQMGRVASSLIGLDVLSVASEAPDKEGGGGDDARLVSNHVLYGVVDPTADNATHDSGTGVKIACFGPEDRELAQLIIGKDVEGSPGLRYVRIPGQPSVYTVKIDSEPFSTAFDDWIEKNLLQIDSFDVEQVAIEDYSVDIDKGTRDYRASFELDYNSELPAGQRWTLDTLKLNREGRIITVPLADSQELSEEALSNMLNALGDLKIVDVRRKPEILAVPLRESKPLGLEMIQAAPQILDILGQRGFYFAEAETDVPGVRQLAIFSSNGELAITMKNGVRYTLRFGRLAGLGSEPETTSEGGPALAMNRYLFVLTEFDEETVKKPELAVLPEIPTDADEKTVEEVQIMREELEKENARLLDHYQEQLESGRKAAAELNKRFADWYYIVSEDVFKKIHLGYDTIIKVKETPEEEIDLSLIEDPLSTVELVGTEGQAKQSGLSEHVQPSKQVEEDEDVKEAPVDEQQ